MESPCEVFKRAAAVKTDVGQIPNIVPLTKIAVIPYQLGHHAQPAVWLEHPEQGSKRPAGVVHMFNDLGGTDEIIRVVEHRGLVKIKRVIEIDPMPLLLQQDRQGRPRAAAEVQPLLPGIQPLQQRCAQSRQKSAIARIPRIVLMQIIGRLLIFAVEPIGPGDEGQIAMQTAQVDSLPVLEKWTRILTVAQGTVGRAVMGRHLFQIS